MQDKTLQLKRIDGELQLRKSVSNFPVFYHKDA